MSTRSWLADRLEQSGASALLLASRRWRRSTSVPVLTFHRVLPATSTPQHQPYLFDDGVFDVTVEQLDRVLAVIREHFNPIGITDLLRFLRGWALPPNPVQVTFDDGYRDNRDLALPLLRRHGVRAVFFVATRYITERRMPWWDRIHFLIKSCARDEMTLRYPFERSFSLRSPAERHAAIAALLTTVKTWFDLDLERFLDELGIATNVPWTDELDHRFADEHLMTWLHVRELAAAGMDIQSHTHTHRVLQTLRPEALGRELDESRGELARELAEAPCAVSYPVGYTLHDRTDLLNVLRASSYQLGFTNRTGPQPLSGAIDPLALRRIGVDLTTPDSLFRAMLAAPRVFARPTARR